MKFLHIIHIQIYNKQDNMERKTTVTSNAITNLIIKKIIHDRNTLQSQPTA